MVIIPSRLLVVLGFYSSRGRHAKRSHVHRAKVFYMHRPHPNCRVDLDRRLVASQANDCCWDAKSKSITTASGLQPQNPGPYSQFSVFHLFTRSAREGGLSTACRSRSCMLVELPETVRQSSSNNVLFLLLNEPVQVPCRLFQVLDRLTLIRRSQDVLHDVA
jgi:hypothetical protein